ncbi:MULTISPECIES: hypothetical protein [Myxococcus]|uniref:hypothetical protein n=1 Tax=Myxococcus TaxID=32 RepID=UPI0015A289C6|nr:MULTISPECIES: hypothetical protein [Myxococcus]
MGPLRHVVQLRRRFFLAVGIALSKPAAEVRRQLPRHLVAGGRRGWRNLRSAPRKAKRWGTATAWMLGAPLEGR